MIDDLFNVGSYAANALRRSLLRYSRPPIEYNFERLPPPEQLRDMELAFREDYFDPPLFSIFSVFPYLKYASIMLAVLAFYMAFGLAVTGAITLILILALPDFFFGQSILLLRRRQIQISLAIFFSLLAATVFLVADMLDYSYLAVIAVGAPAVLVTRMVARDFFDFTVGFMNSHPCLRNDERMEALKQPWPGIDLGTVLTVYVLLVLGTSQSPFLILALIYGVLLYSILRGPLRALRASDRSITLRYLMNTLFYLFTEYFTYGRKFPHPMPGVWTPQTSYLVRRRMATLCLLLLLFSFCVGTSFFFAWDMPGFRGQYTEMFRGMAYDDRGGREFLSDKMPELNWAALPDRDESQRQLERLDSLRIARASADLDKKIEIDIEMNQLAEQVSNAEPELDDFAAAWYSHSTTSWMEMAVRNLTEYPATVAASFGVALLNALLLPALFIVSAGQRTVHSVLRLGDRMGARAATEDTRSPWEWFVDRLRNSRHVAYEPGNPDIPIRESDHLFMGLEATNGFPLLLHRDILAEHAYIAGGSGSGKTSLGILSLLVQLIRSRPQDEENQEGGMPPIVIIDLKGEYALLHTVREEVRKQAEREGRTLNDCFRLFTSEKGMATHYFNPLGDMTYSDRYVSDLANLLLDALELNHGPGYGRSYYSRKNFMLLHEVLRAEDASTFDELCDRVSKASMRTQEERHQAFELLATLYGLTEFKQLKPPPDVPESEIISMRQVVEKRQVVYFWLPTVESSIIAREIGNLALFSYFSAMRSRAKLRVPLRQSYLVVDEFQKLAGDRFNVILQQARGFGLSAILSNQSISDLKTPAYDLRSTVLQNTRLKLYFSFSDCKEMTDFAKRSGDELAYIRSGSYALARDGLPDAPYFDRWSHVIKPRVTTNDMLRVTDHPLQAYMDVRSGSGYTQFGGATLAVQMFHPVRWLDFQQRRDVLPWPSLEEIGVASATEAAVSPEEVDERAISVLARLDARIQKFDDENPHLRLS
ncbi:MAG: type IV secretion system DNA-binding domain-containing protein [Candidatus Hydrogenedentes bacterium]|nr:type IV secretion system DNA-binding domain-containing protein [Candidatus Hydrogenedentota bacterium]